MRGWYQEWGQARILPEALDVLVQNNALSAEQLVNPADVKHRRYVYRRWVSEESKYIGSIPLVWEESDNLG